MIQYDKYDERPNLNIGDQIVVRNCPGLMPVNYRNTTQTVTDVRWHETYQHQSNEFNGRRWVAFFDAEGGRFYCTEWDTAVPERKVGADEVTIPANPTMDELVAIIERCSNDLAQSKRRYESMVNARDSIDRMFQQSIDIIGRRLLEEAEARSWCDEFDKIVAEVNGQLPSHELPTREEDYEVEVEVVGTIRTTTTVTVRASSQDDANSKFDEDPDEYMDDADDVLTNASRQVSFEDVEVNRKRSRY